MGRGLVNAVVVAIDMFVYVAIILDYIIAVTRSQLAVAVYGRQTVAAVIAIRRNRAPRRVLERTPHQRPVPVGPHRRRIARQ